MAKGGDGGDAPAPPHGQVYLPAWRRIYDGLAALLRQTNAQAEALAAELERLQAEVKFLRRGRVERDEILQDRIHQICAAEVRRERAENAVVELLRNSKDLQARRFQVFAELTDTDLEDFKSLVSTLADENAQLKTKLKEAESQAEISEKSVDHRHGAKDLRAELRKLKQAYKTMVSEKDKEISQVCAEKRFVWNQFKTMEEEYKETCKSRSIEAQQATEAAQKLQQTLQLTVKKKDDEISRLRAELISAKAEAVSAKDKMSIIEDELEQMRSLVKGKDVETGQRGTSQKCKKGLNETNRKSKSEGSVLRERSRISQVTPVRRVKTPRKCVSSTKVIQAQSRNSSRMRNTEGRGKSETSQKRKRGSSSLSHGLRRSSTRMQVKPAASPMLFTPSFTIPKLTAPAPPQL